MLMKDKPRQAYQYRYILEPDRELYRQHYQAAYGTSGVPFTRMENAYQLGHDFGRRAKYREYGWNEVEPTVRKEWEESHEEGGVLWEEVSDAVQTGYEAAQKRMSDALGDEERPDWSAHFDSFRTYYREHYETHYAETGNTFSYYMPAYSYGFLLSTDPRYAGADWDDTEKEARRRWEDDGNESTWADIQEAVRHGFEHHRVQRDGAAEEDQEWGRYFQEYREYYKNHYDTTYEAGGRPFSYYAPAYGLGATIGSDPRFSDYDWEQLEEDARTKWEEENQESTWETVKEAVRSGWESVRESVSGS